MTRPATVPLLHALAAMLIAGAVLLALLPAPSHVPPTPPRLPVSSDATGSSTAMQATSADDRAEQIVNTNLFSASRRAPRVAFVAPGLFDSNASVPGDGGVADATAAMPASPELVLEGIVVRDGEPRALLRVAVGDPETPATPRLVAPGDRVGAYRVRSIGHDHVVLASASGVRTLRLQRQLPSDSSAPRP
jgi:hypothetical protein